MRNLLWAILVPILSISHVAHGGERMAKAVPSSLSTLTTEHKNLEEVCSKMESPVLPEYRCKSLVAYGSKPDDAILMDLPFLEGFREEKKDTALMSPSNYLPVSNGLLVSFSSGEFGGGLFWFNNSGEDWYPLYYGEPQELVAGNSENISHILRIEEHIVAIGIAPHEVNVPDQRFGGYDFGGVYVLTQSIDGTWRVGGTFELPYRIGRVWMFEGRVFMEARYENEVLELKVQ